MASLSILLLCEKCLSRCFQAGGKKFPCYCLQEFCPLPPTLIPTGKQSSVSISAPTQTDQSPPRAPKVQLREQTASITSDFLSSCSPSISVSCPQWKRTMGARTQQAMRSSYSRPGNIKLRASERDPLSESSLKQEAQHMV